MKKIRIYQINDELENARYFMFSGLDMLEHLGLRGKLSIDLYNMVWEGDVEDDATLDDIYRQFNINHPEDFRGHSLSCSDIVFMDDKYFYCDDYGWEEVFSQPKKYIVKAYGSCYYKSIYNTREEALAEANKLNEDYYQHKIWNVEEIIDEDVTAEVIDLEENGTRCAGESLEMKIRIAEARRMKQYTEMKEKYPDAMLLYRCGDFYETYYDDAIKAAKVLGITLTCCQGFEYEKGHELASFPHHALDIYLPKLVRAGLRVAILDEIAA